MSSILQACLYNTDPGSSAELHQSIKSLNLVRLVSEAKNEEDLANVLERTSIHVLIVHLDPEPASVTELIEQVAQRFPQIGMIAISQDTNPGAILAPIRAGCDQYVCKPIESEDLAAAVLRIASKRFATQAKSLCVCVTGASGGSGATSIASNLAMEIGQATERPVALVDLDFQFGDIAVNYDLEPKYTMHDAASMGGDLDRSVLESILTKAPCNVMLLPRPGSIEQAEHINPDAVHHVIAMLQSLHETVIVDVPRRMDPCSTAALGQADLVLVICQLLVPSIRNAHRLVQSLSGLGIPESQIEVVANRGDSHGGRISIADLESLIGKPVFACVPNDYQYVARSIDFGQPLASEGGKRNPVRDEIQKIARRIIEGSESDEEGESKRGFLGRFLSN